MPRERAKWIKSKKVEAIIAGHASWLRPHLGKEPFQERAMLLLETMRITDPKKGTLRKAAAQELQSLMSEREVQLKTARGELQRSRASPKLKERELIKLELREARLGIIKALFNDVEPTSNEMNILIKRVNNLVEKIQRLGRI